MRQGRRQKCPIQDHIKIICPYCAAIVDVPMCQAVNGENITCHFCHKNFTFQA